MNAILRNMNPVTPRKIPLAALVVLLALFASFSLFIRPVVAAELTDTTPPVLIDFDFNPKSIDVTNGDATVNITTHVTDDLSGVMGGWVHFYSPSHGQYRTAGITTYHCCPDNWTPPLDAVVQSSLTLPQSSEAGDWVVTGIELWDGTGNTQDIDTATLLSLGFPTILHVISQNPDVTPPPIEQFLCFPCVHRCLIGASVHYLHYGAQRCICGGGFFLLSGSVPLEHDNFGESFGQADPIRALFKRPSVIGHAAKRGLASHRYTAEIRRGGALENSVSSSA